MNSKSRFISTLFLSAALACSVFGIACGHHYYRVYDPYYNDYHVWNNDEVVYYNRWEHDTHRDHVDFRKRKTDDQKEYWTWRHNQH
jgi:hypothetical protein